MNCDSCHNANATIHLTQLVEGKMQKVSLCKQCAEEKGVTDPTGFALADLLEGAGTQSITPSALIAATGEKCDHCGFTETDFKKTGRFVCGHCYQVFRAGLDNLLEAMHRNTTHNGKVPAHFVDISLEGAGAPGMGEISELRGLLKNAVEVEDYEEAARLRDAIAGLREASLDSAGESQIEAG